MTATETEVETPFNIERLREAVAWAEFKAKQQDNGRWYQHNWAKGKRGRRRKPAFFEGSKWTDPDDDLVEVTCLSAFCVAGWVCAGEKDSFVAYKWATNSNGALSADYIVPKGSREMKRVSTRAQELLGITSGEAEDLFAGFNSIKDIKRIAKRIAKKRGETL